MSNLTHDEMTLSPDAVSERPQRGTLSYTRVYCKGGRVAHLLEALQSAASRHPESYDGLEWYGTGSQAEYDRAAAKPLCLLCFRWRELAYTDSRLGTGHGRTCI